jgi:hypothetical protein
VPKSVVESFLSDSVEGSGRREGNGTGDIAYETGEIQSKRSIVANQRAKRLGKSEVRNDRGMQAVGYLAKPVREAANHRLQHLKFAPTSAREMFAGHFYSVDQLGGEGCALGEIIVQFSRNAVPLLFLGIYQPAR